MKNINMRNKNVSYITTSIMIVNVFIFMLGEFVISQTGYDIRNAMCLRYWGGDFFSPLQFLTSMFTHASYSHLLGNMMFLGVFGSAIESKIGHIKYLATYIIGGLIAGAVPMILYHFGIQEMLTVLKAFLADPTLSAASALVGSQIPEFMLGLVIMLAQEMYAMLLAGPAFLGASGAVSVVMGLSLLTHASKRVFKGSFIRLWMIVMLMFYRDLYHVVSDILENGMLGGVSGQMAHLTGYAVGFAYVGFAKVKKLLQK